jgi:type II secretory ATPase GspE/PulE/Tfp pilus assembly ATPase PilB-like protein
MQQVSPFSSAWQKLKNREVTCDEALKLLVDSSGDVNIDLLDQEVTNRFLREFPDRNSLPPLLPLLLWRNCYYLGSPTPLPSEIIRQLMGRVNADIKVIAVNHKSYRAWVHTQHLDHNNRITTEPFVDPVTGQVEQENISEVTELYLSKAADQIERIQTLIARALRNRASDIHLEPQPDGLRVRYRIDGILRNITTLPPEISRRAIVALKVMADMDIAESRRPQDARIQTQYVDEQAGAIDLDMRVSTLPCMGGEKAVIRLLPRENPFSKMDELGFSPRTLETFTGWLKQPQGLIILTGPTGSGKTSTLYTGLQSVATEEVNVVTVEDPVEYVLPQITQTQVHEAAGMTFAVGLRAILRQDPDVIMVGEVRDHETAETAVRAALTGHLVFTTLHTNDAIGAIPRLKDIGPDPGLISDALLGVIAQRLVRKICPHCAVPHTPTPSDLKVLGLTLDEAKPENWRVGKGCQACFNTGFAGREAVIELLNVDSMVRQLIYEGTATQLSRYLHDINYPSFLNSATEKVLQGKTTVQEVLRVLPHSALYPKNNQVNGAAPLAIAPELETILQR